MNYQYEIIRIFLLLNVCTSNALYVFIHISIDSDNLYSIGREFDSSSGLDNLRLSSFYFYLIHFGYDIVIIITKYPDDPLMNSKK